MKTNLDHFALNRWILIGAGLWTPKTNSKFGLFMFRCYAVIIFVFVNIYFISTEFVSIGNTYKNLNSLIKNLSFALTHLLGSIKVLFWYYNRETLMNIISRLEKSEYHYESKNAFQPIEIFKKAKKTGVKYTVLFFVMAHFTMISAYLPPIITTFNNLKQIVSDQPNSTLVRSLPYYNWMPFKYDTPNSYLFALIYQMAPAYSYCYSIVGMDTLFMNTLNLIGAHVSVLESAFRTITIRCVVKLRTVKGYIFNKKELNDMMKREFKLCVQHMQTTFTICDNMEGIYKFLTLLQVLFTLFIFCTCLFLVSTTPVTSKRFVSEMVYLIAMGFQLMLYCWFGNEVTLKASKVPNALWESDWLEGDASYRSNIMIAMIRMRRPLHFTVGKFAPLTLNTFVSILKTSYSLFAVLKRVNE